MKIGAAFFFSSRFQVPDFFMTLDIGYSILSIEYLKKKTNELVV